MIGRARLSLYVIQLSLGLGGSLLAAIFASEAYLHRGFMIPYAVGVFVMVGLCARFFGRVSPMAYCAATLALTALLLVSGIVR